MTKIQEATQLVHFICSIAYYRTNTNNEYFINLCKTDIVSRKFVKEYVHQHQILKEMNAQ